eukprot:6179025-Pleurochrysis_carterae.AAC.2
MMKTQGIGLMTLTDTHLSKEGMEKVHTYLRQEGLGGGDIIAKKEKDEQAILSARRRAGIYYIWDATQVQVNDTEKIYENRVARAKVNVIDNGKELTVYGVYMPVRINRRRKVDEIWEKVMEDITYRGARNFIINGDFNAETETWIEKMSREQKKEDVAYQGVIEDLDRIAGITEDYTFDWAHTQIDNILIPVELLHTLRAAYTVTGVREKDHRMVVAELAWETEGGRGGKAYKKALR